MVKLPKTIKTANVVIAHVHLIDSIKIRTSRTVKEALSHADTAGCVTRVSLFAGTLPEGDGGRGHRRRPGREPGSRDHRPRGQRDGDHPLEPDAGHSEEARVHVAPSAQDLVLFALSVHSQPVSSYKKTLASS